MSVQREHRSTPGKSVLPNAVTEAPAAALARSASEDGRGGEAGAPPMVMRGESSTEKWLGYDKETGERAFSVPYLHRRRVRFRLIPIPDESAHRYGAITDWLNFTFPAGEFKRNPGRFFQHLFDVIGPELAPAAQRPFGRHKYTESFTLGDTQAFVAIGGNRDTCLVSLPGQVCALVRAWEPVVSFGKDELKGHITLWDGAVDDYLGVHSVDEAVRLYQAGLFGAGGRKPRMQSYGNWIEPDGYGRSLGIGLRESGKRLLVYEKGMQLGAMWHPWTRWELKLGNRDRDIPWDVLLQPGQYVAGAYPKALRWIDTEMIRVRTLQKQTQIGYETAVGHAQNQAGAVINLMMQVEGSAEAVVKKLRRDAIPRRVRHPAVANPEGWIE
jgi:Replication initiation factor